MTDRAQLDADHSKAFMLGGNARVTLESQSTGARFTYRIRAAEDGGLYFVSVLTGADNESDFAYLGTIRGDRFEHGRKARLSPDAPSARAFAWAWPHIAAGQVPAALGVWHEGRCGRCNRPLTVPHSIATGFGPECANVLGIAA